MTNRELIQELLKYNMDAEIKIQGKEINEVDEISEKGSIILVSYEL